MKNLVQIGLYFCLLVVSPFFSHGQNDYPPVINYSPKDYNNLSETSTPIQGKNFLTPENTSAVQDQRGVMYFGNANGIIEFDGEEWRFIEVKNGAIVRSLAIDEKGKVYVGSFGEFGYLNKTENNDIQYVSLSQDLPEQFQNFTNVWNIDCGANGTYFHTLEHIYKFDGEKIAVYTPEKNAIHTAYLFQNQMYARVRDKGLCILNEQDSTFDLIPGGDTVANYGVFGILPHPSGNPLVLTQELGLWSYNGTRLTKLQSDHADDINFYSIFGGIQLTDGNYALNSYNSGAVIMQPDGAIIQTITKRNGLRVNDVKSVYQDRNKNLWLPLGNGIAKVNYSSPLSYYSEKAGVFGNVQTIKRFQNQIFVGTSSGLFVQNDAFMTSEFSDFENIKTQVWDLDVWNNRLLISTSEGIYVYDGQTITLKWPYNTNALYVDTSEKRIVSAGGQGIYTFNNGSWSPDFTFTESLSTMMGIEKNPESNDPQYWIGSTNLGVFRLTFYDGFPMLERYTAADGLNPDNLARPLLFEQKVLFGTNAGVLHFINEQEVKKSLPDSLKDDPEMARGYFDIYNVHNKMIDAPFLQLNKGHDKIWVCIDNQVGYYEQGKKALVKRPFWGINLGRINTFYLEDNNVLWIGAADGMVKYKPNKQKDYQSEFHALIRRISVSNDSTIYYGTFFTEGGASIFKDQSSSNITLDYQFNDITFSFAAPYFEDNHKPEYAYMLEGYDSDWSPYQTNPQAKYTNLDEGTYTFKVKAKNVYGQESEVTTYTFTIAPPWYRTTWAYIAYILVLIIIIFIAAKIASYRLKKKNQWLEQIVDERTQEIQQKNVELEHQKDEILHQKTEIEDSINYAQRIQNAILPLSEEITSGLKDVFVLFKPKDIVSGDFYWYGQVGDDHVFVCADCTGHGVPGAFMSMISSDKLNATVREQKITSPDLILEEVNRGIKKALKQANDKDSTRDGMDCAIVTINFAQKTMLYSGANRPLWIVRAGELLETKATKVAVGGLTPTDQKYELHSFEMQSGDQIYLSSDGYADQFGGEKGKKMKVKKFKNKIMEIKSKPMSEQAHILNQFFEEWRGEHEQIDDVCVFGLKFN